MEFRRLVCGGVTYGVGDTAISRSLKAAASAAEGSLGVPPEKTVRIPTSPPSFAGCKASTQQFVAYEEDGVGQSIWPCLQAADEQGCRL
eukprot:5700817-Prymnesium_polylepis.1